MVYHYTPTEHTNASSALLVFSTPLRYTRRSGPRSIFSHRMDIEVDGLLCNRLSFHLTTVVACALGWGP